MIGAVDEAKAAVARSQELEAELEATHVKAKEQGEVAEAAVAAQKLRLAEAARRFQAAKRAVEEAALERERLAEEMASGLRKRAELQSASADLVLPLTQGVDDESHRTDLIKRLRKVLPNFGIEESILVALPDVFGKAPAMRSSFDGMVVTTLQEEIAGILASSDREEAAAREAEAAAVSEAATRAGAFTEVEAKQIEAADEFIGCQTSQEEAVSDTCKSKAAAKEQHKQTERCTREQLKFEKHLEAFRAGPLAAFAELRDREAPALELTEAAEDAVAGLEGAAIEAPVAAA
eukprot:SRR837773.12254.p1 GENE.SRR837773.12254~~SRR837773.12254.p1  ORF type:complete len:327 (+),score=110.77 SRR837773.12254:108-983(+)